MKRISFLSGLMIIFFGFFLVGCDFTSDELGTNEVKVKNSESTFVGTNYEDVVEKLQGWGFTNIETEPVYDIIWGITPEGSTKSVSIDGSSDYKYGDIYDKDVLIIVTYSLRASDDPAKQTYEITWLNEDGTTLRIDDVLVGTLPVYDGNEPSKNAVNEIKYVFNGWTPEIETVTGNKTYTATFTEVDNSFTILFDLDGGYWNLENEQTVIYNGLITSTIPTKDGYDFDGWVIKGFWSDTTFESSTNVQQDYSLTATWVIATHTISFDLDGGTWSRSDDQTVNNNGVITSTEPTKDGYVFLGWLLNDEIFDSSTPITSDLSLKAHWYLPNFEDILVGRWETLDPDMQGYWYSFMEFDGSFYDLDGERVSGLTDYNHDWGSFSLFGNRIGFNFVDSDTIYFTLSYSDDVLVLHNSDYVDIVLNRTEDEPNSLAWKWYHLYQFAQTQSEMKMDEYGVYYEITMDMSVSNLSPTNKLVESNAQVMKVYQNKLIDIYFYYAGVNDPSIEMIVNIAFDYKLILDNIIPSVYISIESENYIMITNKGNTTIEFDQESNLFFYTTSNVQDNVNNYPVSINEVIYTLEYFSNMVLFDVSEFLLIEHQIFFFTE
jgi:uncharacterized repeat protein (TIGR02543 family)